MNLVKGQIISKSEAYIALEQLPNWVEETKHNSSLDTSCVIEACDVLSLSINEEEHLPLLYSLGVGEIIAKRMLSEVKMMLSKEYLSRKLYQELGEEPFTFKKLSYIQDRNIMEKYQPLGVLTHIAAGNAAGLPAFSVIEGLLTGNINILKLPGIDDGVSTKLLYELIKIEPRLSDYIYIFELPSTDVDSISKILKVADAVAVWGSDFAIEGIRKLAPANMKIIEWGHKISFAYVTKLGNTERTRKGIAEDICSSEQLFCSSPQCVYYETESRDELFSFAERLYQDFSIISKQYPYSVPNPMIQAEITENIRVMELEEILGEKKILKGESFNIILEYDSKLRPSLMYRNILVKMLPKNKITECFKGYKSYLQTVGLACSESELDDLIRAFSSCGLCRIVSCGKMNDSYCGESHDGQYAMQSYVRKISVEVPVDFGNI